MNFTLTVLCIERLCLSQARFKAYPQSFSVTREKKTENVRKIVEQIRLLADTDKNALFGRGLETFPSE